MTETTLPSTTPGLPAVLADLNNLFDKRHQLGELWVGEQVFAEELADGGRIWRNLTAEARQEQERAAALAAPLRAKGTLAVRSIRDFVEAASHACQHQQLVFSRWTDETHGAERDSIDFKVPVGIHGFGEPRMPLATAILNATDPCGGLGHGDYRVTLHQDPEPISAVWLAAMNTTLSHLALADVVYQGGGAVVPKAQWPKDIEALAARLGLDMATDLADLLAVANGDHKSTLESSASADANRGHRALSMVQRNSASVRVPTGFVIAWQPLPGYTAPVLFRLVAVPGDSEPRWTLSPVTLALAARALAHQLSQELEKSFEGVGIVRLLADTTPPAGAR